ncbi:MAG TPA: autotransporter-associated beta strand repeat-containing protein [Verrucomicrobiae bacterium]|nr:autotransporter-associated beta strand repeat-containing protein [Verrucomicrobiae bacterium]
MKTRQNPPFKRNHLLAALCLGLCLGLASPLAADKTWDGGGDQSNWSGSPANWDGDTDPVANDRLFFGGNVGVFPNNNFPNDTDFAGIIFNAGADPFTISGNEIDLAANSGITNNSVNVQTFTANIDNNGNGKIHNAAAGPLVYAGVLRNSTFTKEGAFDLTLTGSAGNAGVSAVINDGTLILGKTAGQALPSSPILVNTNGTLRTIGPGTDQIHFNQRVTMNGGVFQLQHVNSTLGVTLEEIAALSGSNLNSIVECGLADSINRLDIGGGNNHRGIYSGTLRDGAAGVLALRVYRANNFQQLNGTNTYTGTTAVDNTQNAGAARLIVNGQHTGGGAYTINGHNSDATRIAYLNGSGVISASVMNFNIRGILSPGGSLSADLTDAAIFTDSTAVLTISNAVNLNDATSTLEIQATGATPGSGYDQVVIAGSGTFSNNNANLRLTLGAFAPASGDKFTIVKVDGTDSAKTMGTFGSFNGVITSMTQGATIVDPDTGQTFRISYRAEGNTFDAGAGNGNDIMLEAISPVGGAVLTWRGDAGPNWDITTTANWRTTGGTASTFTNADFVTFDNSGSNAAPINLVGDLSPATILVNSTNNYEFGGDGKLTGLVILTKTNTGKLTITTENDNTGATLLREGTIQIGTNGITGRLSGNINMRTNTTLIFNRSDVATYSGVISGTGTVANNGTNGTMILTGDSSLSGGVQANAGTLQFGDGTGITGSIAARITNNATVAYNFNNAVVINNSLSGTGVVDLINSTTTGRRFTLPTSLVNHPFSGTFNVGAYVNLATADQSSGTNQLGVGSTVNVADTGSVYLDRNGIYRTTFNLSGPGNGAGSAGVMTLEIEQGSTIVSNVNLLSDVTIGGFLGDATISGRILGATGTETLTFANRRQDAQSYNLRIGSASGPNHWGATIIEPGDYVNQRIRVTALASRAISTNGLTIGAHGIFQLNGFDHTVASLSTMGTDGVFVPSVFNGSATTPAVFTVGTDDASTLFDGVFGNGGAAALGVTKVGAGTLTLTGNNSNSGPVTVSGGTIALSGDGSFSNATQIIIGTGATFDVTTRSDGSLTLNSGQTLKGAGTFNGNLVTEPGSIINPGLSIGTLAVSGNATLGGTLLLEVNRSTVPNVDRLNVSGTLTTGGTLAVTNIGPALQVNDTFALFPAGTSGFTVSLPAIDPLNAVSYTWQNDVALNGSVKVLSVTPITPPTLGVSQTGNTLNFSWTGPFKLQSQTNSLNFGISSNWSDYPGGSASPVSVTINPTNPTVFFRLTLQ